MNLMQASNTIHINLYNYYNNSILSALHQPVLHSGRLHQNVQWRHQLISLLLSQQRYDFTQKTIAFLFKTWRKLTTHYSSRLP